jgi:hypothetical protein
VAGFGALDVGEDAGIGVGIADLQVAIATGIAARLRQRAAAISGACFDVWIATLVATRVVRIGDAHVFNWAATVIDGALLIGGATNGAPFAGPF